MKRFMLFLLFALVTSVATVNADVCERAGNVEASITAPTNPSENVYVTFTNYNQSQVTVTAKITIVAEDNSKKTFTRTFVIAGDKSQKKYRFGKSDINGQKILVNDCSVDMYVEKCDNK